MKRIVVLVSVVSALGLAGVVRAQSATPTYVLTTVDAVQRYTLTTLIVTGVQEGASGASDVRIYGPNGAGGPLDACERFAMTAMAKPGQYRLEIWPGTPNYSYGYCRLTRVNP